ncbi:MAG: hypothetical protein KHY77_11430 [Butyricicoccus pullicaecorum]|nr:hypothetical protein [Butyricicoccus pullicaecorum]
MLNQKDLRIIHVFAQTIPKMSELDKEKLLSFGEGMAFMVDCKTDTSKAQDETQ